MFILLYSYLVLLLRKEDDMSEEIQKLAKQVISGFISKNLDTVVKPLYYPADFLKLDLSNIGIADSWILEECFDGYDETDIYNHEPPYEDKGFTMYHKEESFSEQDILKTYKLTYIGCDNIEEGELSFTIVALKNNLILFVAYSGD